MSKHEEQQRDGWAEEEDVFGGVMDAAYAYERICDLLGNSEDPEQVVREMVDFVRQVAAQGLPEWWTVGAGHNGIFYPKAEAHALLQWYGLDTAKETSP